MASSSRHAWERKEHDWDTDSESEVDPRGWDSSDSGDDAPIDWPTLTPEQMGDELASQLLREHDIGNLSAKAVCTLAFFR